MRNIIDSLVLNDCRHFLMSRSGKYCRIFIFSMLINHSGLSQEFTTEEPDGPTYNLNAGMYLSFDDFINNHPVEVVQIETAYDVNSRDFYTNLRRERTIKILKDDSTIVINPANIWGYSDGKGVYINRFTSSVDTENPNPWAKINFMGTLSLIYYVETGTITYNSALNQPGASQKVNLKRELILDTRTGKFHSSSLKILTMLISDDGELLSELKKSREDKIVKLYVFLRKYNERHPLKFN